MEYMHAKADADNKTIVDSLEFWLAMSCTVIRPYFVEYFRQSASNRNITMNERKDANLIWWVIASKFTDRISNTSSITLV